MITNTIAKWLLKAFGVAIVGINAALTAVFGFTYLGAAFGAGELAAYAGAIYAVLILDVGYIAWYLAFKNDAETNGQRAMAAIMAVVALLGSIGATLNQLAVNSFALVDLTQYHDAVGLIALITMLVVTALHIVATAGYSLLANAEWARQTMINIKAGMLDASLKEAESRVQSDADLLVDYMAAASRAEILAELGFTADVKPAGKEHQENGRQANNGGGLGYKTKTDAMGVGLFARKKRLVAPAASAAQPARMLSYEDGQFSASWIDSDGLGYASDLIVSADPGAAWADLNQKNMIPAGMTYSTFRRLHQNDQETRAEIAQRQASANPTQGAR